jgi:cobalamin synthase
MSSFKNIFKKQNPDERLQLIGFKAGFYGFFVIISVSFAVAFLFMLRLEGRIDIMDEAFGLLLLLPFFAGSGFVTLYLLKNGFFAAQREAINQTPRGRNFKWFVLIGQFAWMLIFIPAFMHVVFKEPWRENIGVGIFTAFFTTFFAWYFQYRSVRNIEEE